MTRESNPMNTPITAPVVRNQTGSVLSPIPIHKMEPGISDIATKTVRFIFERSFMKAVKIIMNIDENQSEQAATIIKKYSMTIPPL